MSEGALHNVTVSALRVRSGDATFDEFDGLSRRDLEDWLNSPFWSILTRRVREHIKDNQEDLVRGDIQLRTKDEEGYLYRSNEALRGSIIALEHFLHMADEMREDIQLALEDREVKDGKES